ncbi:GspH/FimT family pseudopilin [Candidatus Sumerlaeota bacterium]|nr:GspH/FimT family pseudopilin [Candidatus Sumerlaeota bacterium]
MMMRGRRGFTFLELIIVICILGILAMLTIPKMGNVFRHGQLEAGTRELAATLRYARNAAILRSDGCEVRFDPKEGQYQLLPVHLDLEGQPAEDRRTRRRRDDKDKFDLNEEATQIHSLPSTTFFNLVHSTAPVTEDRRLPRVIFYPDGSASTAYIGVQNSENRALAVEIYRTTGLASIHAGVPVLPKETQPLYYLPEKIQYGKMR